MSDLISRQALIERLFGNASEKELEGLFCEASYVLRIINKQPPADKWIPVAEKLPSKEDIYLCFLNTGTMETLRFTTDLYEVDKYDFYEHRGKAGFYAYDSEWGYSEVDYITAWAELPEPYKGVE